MTSFTLSNNSITKNGVGNHFLFDHTRQSAEGPMQTLVLAHARADPFHRKTFTFLYQGFTRRLYLGTHGTTLYFILYYIHIHTHYSTIVLTSTNNCTVGGSTSFV